MWCPIRLDFRSNFMWSLHKDDICWCFLYSDNFIYIISKCFVIFGFISSMTCCINVFSQIRHILLLSCVIAKPCSSTPDNCPHGRMSQDHRTILRRASWHSQSWTSRLAAGSSSPSCLWFPPQSRCASPCPHETRLPSPGNSVPQESE